LGATDDIISELFLLIFGVVIIAFAILIISYSSVKIVETLRGAFSSILKMFTI